MKEIKCRYAPFVLVPHEAIVGSGPGGFVTLDGKVCDAVFVTGYNNREGDYDKELDEICRKNWEIPFSQFKSFWYERCWRIEGFWHYIQLKEK